MKILTEWSGFQFLGLGFTGFLPHGLSRLRTRPNGSALWKPATFEKVDKAFALGVVDAVLYLSLIKMEPPVKQQVAPHLMSL